MKSKTVILKKENLPAIPPARKNSGSEVNLQKESTGLGKESVQPAIPLRKKILVVDDDPAIIDVLTLMLEAAGYEVYGLANLKTVTDVSGFHADLILLDILMSGINGRDICRRLKEQPSTKHIPIIMISANKDAKDIASDACADDFIAKPFHMNTVLKKVLEYIEQATAPIG